MDLQDSIIRRHRLESNISVPAIASEFTWFSKRVNHWSSPFLLLDTADDANLVTKLAAGFCDGMDVKA